MESSVCTDSQVVLIVDCATSDGDADDDLDRCPGTSAEGRAIAAFLVIYYVGILSFFLVASWVRIHISFPRNGRGSPRVQFSGVL